MYNSTCVGSICRYLDLVCSYCNVCFQHLFSLYEYKSVLIWCLIFKMLVFVFSRHLYRILKWFRKKTSWTYGLIKCCITLCECAKKALQFCKHWPCVNDLFITQRPYNSRQKINLYEYDYSISSNGIAFYKECDFLHIVIFYHNVLKTKQPHLVKGVELIVNRCKCGMSRQGKVT